MNIVPVILSGGSGTRLWPLSRQQYPKQFLSLLGNNSMFQETILRLKGLESLLDPIVVCNDNHRFLVAEQLNQIGINNASIILEPVGRNTAPAITAAMLQIINGVDKQDSIMLVLSADHEINDIEEFQSKINRLSRIDNLGRKVRNWLVDWYETEDEITPNTPSWLQGVIE